MNWKETEIYIGSYHTETNAKCQRYAVGASERKVVFGIYIADLFILFVVLFLFKQNYAKKTKN